uniref:Uncharacterized protein n=1 Tax=Romanomermis culicivorax TaxID=13658 RepID=A0A915I2G9_ROMCU
WARNSIDAVTLHKELPQSGGYVGGCRWLQKINTSRRWLHQHTFQPRPSCTKGVYARPQDNLEQKGNSV